MENCDKRKNIYIVLTQTGTLLSRLLKRLTGAPYNHSSISLTEDLSCMYSFGRRFPRNPFWGGFVKESLKRGTFKRFFDTEATVYSIAVSCETYQNIRSYLADMYEKRKQYGYNYAGLFMAFFGKYAHTRKRYYCSEFVREVLVKFHVIDAERFPKVVKPIDLACVCERLLYTGKLRDYPQSKEKGG